MFGEKIGEQCLTTGTGTFTLGGAFGAFRTWRTAFPTGKKVPYLATNQTGSIWEIGWGTFTQGSPSDTLTRNLVASSTTTLINWSVTPYYVVNVPVAFVLSFLTSGGTAVTRPDWLETGGNWQKIVDANSWTTGSVIDYLFDGSADIEKGKYEALVDIYTPSPRKYWIDKAASNHNMAATDLGRVVCFDVSAGDRTLNMVAGAPLAHGFEMWVLGYGSVTNNVILDPAASEAIDHWPGGTNVSLPGNNLVKLTWDANKTQWRTTYNWNTGLRVSRRQTVSIGPISTAGLPTFLPSTNGALQISTTNVNLTKLVATAANGWDYQGRPLDRIGVATANFVWTGLTASRAAATPNFLYVVINSDGSFTPGSTLLPPIYQAMGTPATTSGQFTFNIHEMKGYLGNGTTAPEVFLVFMGEAATDGSGVISTVAYAYNGRYEGAWTATLWANLAAVSWDHNLGLIPRSKDVILECTTADFGYLVGEQISMVGQTLTSASSGIYHPMAFPSTRNSMRVKASSNNAFIVTEASSGANSNLTAASWKYKPIADRGWA
jgi:hypothetical protein